MATDDLTSIDVVAHLTTLVRTLDEPARVRLRASVHESNRAGLETALGGAAPTQSARTKSAPMKSAPTKSAAARAKPKKTAAKTKPAKAKR